MRRIVALITLFLLTVTLFGSSSVGVSIGLFDVWPKSVSFDQGTFVQSGVVVGIAPSWELEAVVMSEVTPNPFQQLFGSIGTSFALMGPVYKGLDEVPPYANAYVGAGIMGNIRDLSAWGPFVKITPLSVGGPQFKVRERTLTLALFYNIPSNSLTFYWNLFNLDFF